MSIIGKRVKVKKGFVLPTGNGLNVRFIKNRVGVVLCGLSDKHPFRRDDLLIEMDATIRATTGGQNYRGYPVGHDGLEWGPRKAQEGHGWWLTPAQLEEFFEIIE